MLCELCQKNKSSCSAVIDGQYYRGVCSACKTAKLVISSGHARWERSIDIEDHEHEIQQPYNADGSINTLFAKLYPVQAKALFTEDKMRDANRR